MNFTAVVAQFPVTLSIQQNLEVIDSVLEQTSPGDLVLFPEGSVSGYSTDLSFLAHINQSELTTGLQHLQRQAEGRRINVWAGACITQAGQWFNAAYGFCADGRTLVYHKINLANHERGVFAVGNTLPVFELNATMGKVVVGVQICRELRYPEQWGWLARRGAQIMLHLNNAIGDDAWQPIWKSHLVSRAAETQRFVLSANNAAAQQVCPTLAVAPDGHVMGEAISEKLEILRLDLDLTRVSSLYLDQRRTDVVAIKSGPDQNAAESDRG